MNRTQLIRSLFSKNDMTITPVCWRKELNLSVLTYTGGELSGNKFTKLKYNVMEADRLNHTTLVAFGGQYSNLVAAASMVGRLCNFNTVGIIRGEENEPVNSTLRFAMDQGMKLRYISRGEYRLKEREKYLENLQNSLGRVYILPEGGTNALAVKGTSELITDELVEQFQYFCCPVGTGGTLAGIVEGLRGRKSAIGISVLKGGTELSSAVQRFTEWKNFSIELNYHFGGYAKRSDVLDRFIEEFQQFNPNLPIEPIYTGRLFYCLIDKISKGELNGPILAFHTGVQFASSFPRPPTVVCCFVDSLSAEGSLVV